MTLQTLNYLDFIKQRFNKDKVFHIESHGPFHLYLINDIQVVFQDQGKQGFETFVANNDNDLDSTEEQIRNP